LRISECALDHVRFRVAMHPMWCMADCGFFNLRSEIRIEIPAYPEGWGYLIHLMQPHSPTVILPHWMNKRS